MPFAESPLMSGHGVSRVGSRRTRGAFAAIGALLVAGVLLAALGVPVAAAEDAGENPAAPLLVVAPQQPVLSVGEGEYVFEVLIRNPGAEELPEGALRLSLAPDRLESTEVTGSEDAEESEDAAEVTIAEAAVAPTGAESEQAFTVTVPADALPLDAVSLPGVYKIRAELNTTSEDAAQDRTIVSTTTIVWRGMAFSERVPVSLIVPIVLPEGVRSMPTRDDLGEAAPKWDALLTVAQAWQSTLAVDPRVIAGIRAYGEAAPQPARDLLLRLETSELPIFLLQFADADPVAQAALGFEELLNPTGLSYVTRNGSFEAQAPDEPADGGVGAPDSDGTETDGGADGVDGGDGTDGENSTDTNDGAETDVTAPSLQELLAWPTASAGAWPADGQADAKTLNLLQDAGVTELVLADRNVTGATTARAELGDFDVLVADSALGADAAVAIGAASETERASGLAAVAADLALRVQPSAIPDPDREDPAAVVLALDRGSIADAEAPAQFVQEIAALGWLRPASAEELPVSTATLNPGEPSEQRIELLSETLDRSAQIDELAPLLDHPGYLTQYQRVRLLNTLATRHAAPGVDFAAVDRVTRNRDATLLEGVRIVPSENTQLVGASSNVPVLVHNALPFDATIALRAAPTSAAITLTDRIFPDEAVAAEGNSTVLVPVRSRVSSGSSGLIVQVADSADDTVFSSAMLRLTLRSSYETILLITLGGLTAVLLGFGVWRSILRRRVARSSPSAE